MKMRWIDDGELKQSTIEKGNRFEISNLKIWREQGFVRFFRTTLNLTRNVLGENCTLASTKEKKGGPLGECIHPPPLNLLLLVWIHPLLNLFLL